MLRTVTGAIALALVLSPSTTAAATGASAVTVGHITNVSGACRGQNAEVQEAADPVRGYVYEAWMGCHGIGFARSTDGGRHFGAPTMVPDLYGSNGRAWDPAVTTGPDGTVYVAFMLNEAGYTFPVVAASFDQGRSFPQIASLIPPVRKNWGDRDFIAVAPDGTVYLTWDYGPKASVVTYICSQGGSCAFATGDLNVVIQTSTDHGRRWGPIVTVSPGFPASGGDSGPMVVEPGGRVDVLYQGYRITNDHTYTMKPAHEYFTSSTDRGSTWSAPVLVGQDRPDLTMSLAEWWIDGAIGIDPAGNLYATWDTQVDHRDVGWLAVSTDHGRQWSPLVRVTPDRDNAPHIVQVVGAGKGSAYVGWLSDSGTKGWAEYVRVYSLTRGWLTSPVRVSGALFGDPAVWPGDTFGLATLSSAEPIVSWGSASPTSAPNPKSEIYAARLHFAGA